jgi:hypothetical protein
VVSRAPLVALALAFAACRPPGEPLSTRPAPPGEQFMLADLLGGWRWVYRTEEAGTSRVEEETWRLAPDPHDTTHLLGRYVRTVEVRSLDRVPFECNQRPWYRQRAVYDIVAERGDGGRGFQIRELSYTTEPSPCDHGFRHLGSYTAVPRGARMLLTWQANGQSGTETLWQTDADLRPLPAAPWPDHVEPTGAWRWDATSYDAQGNIRDEHEWWEITRRSPTQLDATYRRRVTTRSPDGSPIACAHAPSWSFDDAYVLEGVKEEAHWHFYEKAVAPGDHACLRATPKRDLDEATAEQIGDFFVLEWRGKRHEVLYRPDDQDR